MPEQLAGEPFGPVTNDRTANLPRGRNPEPGGRLRGLSDEQRHESAARAEPRFVGQLKLCPAPDVLARPERSIHTQPRFVSNPTRVPVRASARRKPSIAYALWPDDASKPAGRPS